MLFSNKQLSLCILIEYPCLNIWYIVKIAAQQQQLTHNTESKRDNRS